MGNSHVIRGQDYKTLLTDCEVGQSYSTDVCPGGSQLNLGGVRNENRTCQVLPYNRGWGTGCLEFGMGMTATCVELECSTSYAVKLLSSSGVVSNMTIGYHGKNETKLIANNIPQTFKFGGFGKTVVTCQLENDRLATTNYAIVGDDGAGLFLKKLIDDWPGVFRTQKHMIGMDRVVNWGPATPNEIPVVSIDNPHLDWKAGKKGGTPELDTIFWCRTVLEKLITGEFSPCKITLRATVVQGGYGNEGVLVVQTDDDVPEICSIALECVSCGLTSKRMMFQPGTKTGQAHVTCGNKSMFVLLIVLGSAWFVYGDVGCGIDTDRKTLVCGGGLFVWKEIGQYPTANHSVELASYDLIKKYLFEMFKETKRGASFVRTSYSAQRPEALFIMPRQNLDTHWCILTSLIRTARF